MESQQIRQRLLTLLTNIAPDVEPASVDPDRDFRDQFDFDSMDALHFAMATAEEFGVEVAQTDYPRLASLRGATEFVATQLARRG